MKKCVFAGTFDPPTVGHKGVVESALKIFDKVTVAVLINTQKQCLFSLEERLELLRGLFKDNERVKVMSFDGAAVDLLRAEDTPFYVRGVRDALDFEYENRDFFASKKLMPQMVAVYIPAEQPVLHVSSTLVRNSVKFKKEFADYIPQEIRRQVMKMLEEKNV